MEFSNSDYGDVFADVYDAWYHDLDDISQVVAFVSGFAGSTRVLELGVGTGRLAIPLADAGLDVVGIDNSALMLRELAPKVKPAHRLTTVRGHMVADMPEGPFGVVFAPYNTLFNLMSGEEQTECLRQAARRLTDTGVVIVDCFIPFEPKVMKMNKSVIRASDHERVFATTTINPDTQIIEGMFDEERSDGFACERYWEVRYASIDQIDAMAAAAGLTLVERWGTYDRQRIDESSARHISVYGHAR
jgi:SAM-dependent methyltransferase